MVRYEAVQNRSKLVLEAKSSVHPIHAAAERLYGFLEAQLQENGRLDLSVSPTGSFEVAVEELKSGNALIDHTMQGRLDTRRYPALKAELAEVRETDTNGQYRATGHVTFHGVTQRLEDELLISQLDEHTIEVRGQTTVDVRTFNIKPPRLLMLKVEPEVKVTLNVIAQRIN